MDIINEYLVMQILKTLQDNLLSINSRTYRLGFKRVRQELSANHLCESISIRLKTADEAMITIVMMDKRHLINWDIKNKKVVYKGARSHAVS